MSRTERADLCDLALQVGENEPTLCADWTVKDLVVHLLVREGSPAAVGIGVPQLSKVTDLASNRIGTKDFTVLVERLRTGPPIYSPFRVSKIDKLLNTLEYFVHHEDIRRAQPTWEPRTLSRHQEKVLWKQISIGGKRLVGSAGVGVIIERSDTGERAVLKRSGSSVVVRGLPGELALFLYGRRDQAQVELDGTDAGIATLTGTALGF
jgi:uncharacterized protein (TIGR03085 family)